MHSKARMLFPMLVMLLGMSAAAQPAPEGSERFSMAETANVLITLHSGQVQLAQVALDRLQDQQVRELAQQTLERHAELNGQILAFVDRHRIEPSQTAVSTQLKDRMVAHEFSLQRVSSAAVDDAFLRQQAALYQVMLSLMDDRLLPSAENIELRELLKRTRAELAQQLSRAGWLQAKRLRPESGRSSSSSRKG
jgi:putative membrane protein